MNHVCVILCIMQVILRFKQLKTKENGQLVFTYFSYQYVPSWYLTFWIFIDKQNLIKSCCDEWSLSFWGFIAFVTILFRYHAIEEVGRGLHLKSKSHFRSQGEGRGAKSAHGYLILSHYIHCGIQHNPPNHHQNFWFFLGTVGTVLIEKIVKQYPGL